MKLSKKEIQEKNQLTHERVHALKMFTKDLKENKKPEIKSIPVELVNEYCTHVSPKN